MLRMARKSGHYPLLSRGDINLYSLFVERAHALVKPGGMVGLLTPSGIASDLSASEFFRKVATGGHLKALYDFENRRTRYNLEPFFPDVDSRFKFAAMISSPNRAFAAAQCGFFLQAVSERNNPDQTFPITASDFARVNPNTGTAPIFRTRRDMALTTAIYERCPVLVDKSGDEAVAAWPVKYATMFHMANDSHLFRTRAELAEKESAWHVGGNRWQSAEGEWVPLYQGRMIQQFNHRAAGVIYDPTRVTNAYTSARSTNKELSDPSYFPDSEYFISSDETLIDAAHKNVIAYRRIARSNDNRTVIASMVRDYGYSDSVFLVTPADKNIKSTSYELLSNFNSLIFDYVARQKLGGTNLSWFFMEQLPVIPPTDYARTFGPKTAADIVKAAVLELTYTAHDMAPFARDMGYVDATGEVLPPFIWDEERRLHLRAKLDALYFILYGVFDPADPAQSRDDIRYIYSTFPIVERQETAAYGSYRSRDLCLAYINSLIAGQPDAIVAG
jgi:hypothetical protein